MGLLPSPGGKRQVVLDTLEFGSKIKKTPVVVDNCTGFAVNRVFFPYTQVYHGPCSAMFRYDSPAKPSLHAFVASFRDSRLSSENQFYA